jgi:hypothetical protein
VCLRINAESQCKEGCRELVGRSETILPPAMRNKIALFSKRANLGGSAIEDDTSADTRQQGTLYVFGRNKKVKLLRRTYSDDKRRAKVVEVVCKGGLGGEACMRIWT